MFSVDNDHEGMGCFEGQSMWIDPVVPLLSDYPRWSAFVGHVAFASTLLIHEARSCGLPWAFM
jgi:hypothetical protein